MSKFMRKLVTIRKINELLPIEDADLIELAKIDGWQVVVNKGLYKVNDYVIYCEIDSWIPHTIAPFLSKGKEPKEYNGVKGEKLRTIRLRKVLSQGLILPIDILIKNSNITIEEIEKYPELLEIDYAEAFNIQKWEVPIPAQMNGVAKGNFPSFIPKTDAERIQNLWKEYKEKYNDIEWEVSLKLDGTSFTCFYNEGTLGVCSRNLELLEDDSNLYWKIAKQYNLKEKLEAYGKNIAIQGEIIGEGIQGNPENIKGQQLYIFNIYDIDNKRYLTSEERLRLKNKINEMFPNENVLNILFGIYCHGYRKLSEFDTLEDLLQFAEGKSLNSDCREGLVFKSSELINGEILSFKVISNKFLEKVK